MLNMLIPFSFLFSPHPFNTKTDKGLNVADNTCAWFQLNFVYISWRGYCLQHKKLKRKQNRLWILYHVCMVLQIANMVAIQIMTVLY